MDLTAEENEKLPVFRKMILGESNLNSPLKDEFLIKFLRARKGDLDRSFEMVKRYFRAKLEYPTVYENFYPSANEPTCQGVLKSRDVNDRLVVYVKASQWDPAERSVEAVMRMNLIIFEQISQEAHHQLNGIIGVFDCSGLGLAQVSVLRPWHAKMIMAYLQDSFPVRYKEIHVIFNPFLFTVIFALIKPFMKEKMKRRLILHGNNLETFYKSIPKKNLPCFLGGTNPHGVDEEFYKEMLKRDEEYKELAKYGYK